MSQARVKSSDLRDGEERSVSQPLHSEFPCSCSSPGYIWTWLFGKFELSLQPQCLESFEICHANVLFSQDLYKNGGLISVTSRILVVDMLQSDLPTELVTGLLILHAEK